MLLDRFLRYISIDTQSDENSTETPSTSKQYDLLNLLSKELLELGIKNEVDQYGRVYARIPGNNAYPTIGLCSHVDTALECGGKCDNYQVIKDYNGQDVQLGNTNLFLSKDKYPKLSRAIGKTLITTGGTSLLGGDDKAGLAIIMTTLERYLEIPEAQRYPMAILFTPDEEIGRGPEHFDPVKYGAKFAYTIDGAEPEFIEFENFNAMSIDINVTGVSIHPGDAKDTMVNASLVLNEFIRLLPDDKIPSKTSGYQGFNHLCGMEGSVEKAEAHYILRNHSRVELESQVNEFKNIVTFLNKKYPTGKVEIVVKEQYKNMAEIIEKNPECKLHIESVMKRLGIPYQYHPIRGGTDGATFSFKGCPCPNLGTGSYNHHGRYEYAILEEMEQLVNICLEIYKISQ